MGPIPKIRTRAKTAKHAMKIKNAGIVVESKINLAEKCYGTAINHLRTSQPFSLVAASDGFGAAI